ncbi:hypothetical protein BDV97DRAFT_361242 [Delphinella strobiligena]|nr:hypothetical protein BDV97DRAFT_361242 [Delphinella strobiligena]
MLRFVSSRASVLKVSTNPLRASAIQVRTMADTSEKATKAAHEAAHSVGADKNRSAVSSSGSIGKHFNPDGAIGQIGEKVGGPFSKDGAIGSQFDASKDGVAGTVEKAVDGPAAKTKK